VGQDIYKYAEHSYDSRKYYQQNNIGQSAFCGGIFLYFKTALDLYVGGVFLWHIDFSVMTGI
jgi:hypothetical protein